MRRREWIICAVLLGVAAIAEAGFFFAKITTMFVPNLPEGVSTESLNAYGFTTYYLALPIAAGLASYALVVGYLAGSSGRPSENRVIGLRHSHRIVAAIGLVFGLVLFVGQALDWALSEIVPPVLPAVNDAVLTLRIVDLTAGVILGVFFVLVRVGFGRSESDS